MVCERVMVVVESGGSGVEKYRLRCQIIVRISDYCEYLRLLCTRVCVRIFKCMCNYTLMRTLRST